jgi:hypothetical protein
MARFMTLSSCFLFYFLIVFLFLFFKFTIMTPQILFRYTFIELFLSMYFLLPCCLLCKYMNKNKYHAIHSTMNFVIFLNIIF